MKNNINNLTKKEQANLDKWKSKLPDMNYYPKHHCDTHDEDGIPY